MPQKRTRTDADQQALANLQTPPRRRVRANPVRNLAVRTPNFQAVTHRCVEEHSDHLQAQHADIVRMHRLRRIGVGFFNRQHQPAVRRQLHLADAVDVNADPKSVMDI